MDVTQEKEGINASDRAGYDSSRREWGNEGLGLERGESVASLVSPVTLVASC